MVEVAGAAGVRTEARTSMMGLKLVAETSATELRELLRTHAEVS